MKNEVKSLTIRVKGIPPTLNHDTKHSVRGGRIHSYKTQESEDFAFRVKKEVLAWHLKNTLLCNGNSIFIAKVSVFSPKVLKTKTTKKRGVEILGLNKTFGDADNRFKPAQDGLFKALQFLGYEVDDHQVVKCEACKEYTEGEPFTIIELLAIGNVEEFRSLKKGDDE
jgi:Holliday junction resolvase RusA-like endonuclease